MSSTPDASIYAELRQRMVAEQLRARGIADARVLDAMSRVPRHEFVGGVCREKAYDDGPLPIGAAQTISQPYIVAIMLESLALVPADHVLEVGTGSGYVTALLAELVADVVSIERHLGLVNAARELLTGMGYKNIHLLAGDGTRGFLEFAPYTAIIVSAAAREIPRPLFDQLAEGGRLIIPVGPSDAQQLQLIHKRNGEAVILPRELCRFVPLISGEGNGYRA